MFCYKQHAFNTYYAVSFALATDRCLFVCKQAWFIVYSSFSLALQPVLQIIVFNRLINQILKTATNTFKTWLLCNQIRIRNVWVFKRYDKKNLKNLAEGFKYCRDIMVNWLTLWIGDSKISSCSDRFLFFVLFFINFEYLLLQFSWLCLTIIETK